MMGLLLPRLFPEPSHLLLAACGYLAVMVAVDRVFGSRPEKD
jgi:hypothetical protein